MITVYGTPACQPCRLAERQLKKENVPHTYVDLTEHPAKLEEFKAAGIRQTPIIETPSERFTGLQPDRIKQAAAEVRTLIAAQYQAPNVAVQGVER